MPAVWRSLRLWLRPALGFLVLLGPLPAAWAQQVLVQANVADDTMKTRFGPNRAYFAHAYLGYGLVAGPADAGAALRYGPASAELQAGGRFKARLNNTVALNLDLGYAYQHYRLAQNDRKTVPTPTLHRRESLALHHVYSEFSLRLNAGRRGNAVGRYLDLLAHGSLVTGSSRTIEDEPNPGIRSVETTEYGLPYVRRWTGGGGVRLGLDRYAFVGRYRLTSIFGPNYASWPELPRWVLGIELGIF